MRLLSSFLSQHFLKWLHKETNPNKRFIFYKLVDFSTDNHHFTLQCINTNRLFYATVAEIMRDVDILYALHPVQACYIGVIYRQSPTYLADNIAPIPQSEKKLSRYQYSRYGQYKISYQTQKSIIGFVCKKTNQEFSMDARDLALSEQLICEFDAIDAFLIGQEAGKVVADKLQPLQKENKPKLRIVK